MTYSAHRLNSALGVIDIDIPPDAETQRLVSAELLFRPRKKIEKKVVSKLSYRMANVCKTEMAVANFKVISIVKFAIIGTIEVLSDIDSTNIPALLARRYWENARLRDKLLEQERLDDLKATLTQALNNPVSARTSGKPSCAKLSASLPNFNHLRLPPARCRTKHQELYILAIAEAKRAARIS